MARTTVRIQNQLLRCDSISVQLKSFTKYFKLEYDEIGMNRTHGSVDVSNDITVLRK